MIGWLICKLWNHAWVTVSTGQKPCADILDVWAVMVCRRCRGTTEVHHIMDVANTKT
jgi:hypothetical protein